MLQVLLTTIWELVVKFHEEFLALEPMFLHERFDFSSSLVTGRMLSKKV